MMEQMPGKALSSPLTIAAEHGATALEAGDHVRCHLMRWKEDGYVGKIGILGLDLAMFLVLRSKYLCQVRTSSGSV